MECQLSTHIGHKLKQGLSPRDYFALVSEPRPTGSSPIKPCLFRQIWRRQGLATPGIASREPVIDTTEKQPERCPSPRISRPWTSSLRSLRYRRAYRSTVALPCIPRPCTTEALLGIADEDEAEIRRLRDEKIRPEMPGPQPS